jgi:hypothetical protein
MSGGGTFSSENRLTLSGASKVATFDAAAPTEEQPVTSTVDGTDKSGTTPTVADETIPAPQEESTGVVDTVGTGAEADPKDSPQAPTDSDAAPPKDDSHGTAPASPPKKPVHAHPIKDALKNVEDTIKKVTGVEKSGGAENDGVEKGGVEKGGVGAEGRAAAKSTSSRRRQTSELGIRLHRCVAISGHRGVVGGSAQRTCPAPQTPRDAARSRERAEPNYIRYRVYRREAEAFWPHRELGPTLQYWVRGRINPDTFGEVIDVDLFHRWHTMACQHGRDASDHGHQELQYSFVT